MTRTKKRGHVNRCGKKINRLNTFKHRHKKKSKTMKGGKTVYGRGYGANCNDPNYSIYNTNLLKLFPYKA